jgi:hypothetical protein
MIAKARDGTASVVSEAYRELFTNAKRQRPLLPKRVAALWEGPVPFGRNRESRNREAAGAGIGPKACPGNERQKKVGLLNSEETAKAGGARPSGVADLLGQQKRSGVHLASTKLKASEGSVYKLELSSEETKYRNATAARNKTMEARNNAQQDECAQGSAS